MSRFIPLERSAEKLRAFLLQPHAPVLQWSDIDDAAKGRWERATVAVMDAARPCLSVSHELTFALMGLESLFLSWGDER